VRVCLSRSSIGGRGQRGAHWSRLGLLYGANMFQIEFVCVVADFLSVFLKPE